MPSALSVSKAYAVLGNLIRMGFDTAGVSAGDTRIVLKTLNHREEYMMVFSYGSAAGVPKEVRLAYATFMLGNTCVLDDRSGQLEGLVRFYGDLPGVFTNLLLELLDRITLRAMLSSDLLLGFCFSSESRRLWRVFGDRLGSAAASGVRGTDSLGLNIVQEQWVSLNRGIEDEQRDTTEMRRAMFIASAYNPKGVEKVSMRMDSKDRNQVEERAALLRFGSLVNRESAMGIVKTVAEGWAPKIVTTADMLNELNKQMRGEKDKHDLFVESYFKRKAEEAAALAVQEDAERKIKFRKFDPSSVFQGQAAVTQEEMESAMRGEIDIRDLVAGRPQYGDLAKSGKVRGHRVIRQ